VNLWLNSSWLLLLLPLVLRLLPLPSDGKDRWRLSVDLPLALVCALGTLAIKYLTVNFKATGLLNPPFFSSDEPMVCSTLIAMSTGEIQLVERQPGAALLPGLLSRWLPAVDALGLSAMVATASLGACWYLLARLLAGRTAGLAAALFSCAMTPLVLMPRNLTFYPTATLAMLIGTLCGALVLLRPGSGRGPLLLAGIGAGVALLGDFIGLFIAGPTLAIGLIRALENWRKVPRRQLAMRVALLMLPVLISYGVGRVITPARMHGLETQTQKYLSLGLKMRVPAWATRLKAPESLHSGEPAVDVSAPVEWIWRRLPDLDASLVGRDYRWGRSSPVEMAASVVRIFLFSFAEPDPDQVAYPNDKHRDMDMGGRLAPWFPLLLLSLVVVCVSLRARPWVLAGFLLLLLPYALLLRQQMSGLLFPRFLFAPMAAWPVLLGVAWASASQRDEATAAPSFLKRLLFPTVSVAALALLLSGLVPSFLAPDATWRKPYYLGNPVFLRLATHTGYWQKTPDGPMPLTAPTMQPNITRKHNPETSDNLIMCSDLFQRQGRRGIDPRGTLYGRWWDQ